MEEQTIITIYEKCFANISLCTESDYVNYAMYPKQILPSNYLIAVTVLLLLIFVSGLVGNVCVCLVIAKHAGMRTSTNYYLFSLAVSDLLLLVFGLPQELVYYWKIYPDVFGSFMCKVRAFTSEASSYASVLTVVAFSVERYIAICHPLHSYASGLKRATAVIISIWIVCFICALPQTLETDVLSRTEFPPYSGRLSPLSTVCAPPNPIPASLETFLLVMSILLFFVPMTVLVVVYVRIGLCIRSRNKRSELSQIEGRVHSNGNAVRNKTAIRVLVAVVIAFFVCWAPFHFQRVANSHLKSHEAQRILYVCTGLLYYLSATVNPIFYNAMSRRYRLAFKETFLGVRYEDSTDSRTAAQNRGNYLIKFVKGSSSRNTTISLPRTKCIT